MTSFAWPTRPLGELFTIAAGKSVTPDARRGPNRYPFLRTANVLWGKIDLSEVDEMHFTQGEIREKTLAPGDLLVCEGGDVGRAAVWNSDLRPCSFQNHLHRLRAISDDLVPQFFVYALQAGFTQLGTFEGAANRTTIPNLSRNRLAQLSVPVPTGAEQERIALLLSKVQSAIDLQDRLVATTHELKRATIEQLFTRGLREEPQKETEIGPVPESWTAQLAEQLFESLRYGTSVKCGYGDGVPVLRIPNVADGRVVLADLKRGKLSAEEIDLLRLREGDILFVRTNGVRERVGRTAVYRGQPENALFASYLIRARVREGAVDPDFFHYFTVSEAGRAQLSGRSSPAADGKFNINTKTIGTIVVPIPHASEQREIVAVLNGIDDKIVVHERKLALLRELFDTLLHDLMTGRLRVSDVDVTALDGGGDAEMRAALRGAMRVRVVSQTDDGGDADVADRTPEQRLAMMWQLTRDAWAFTKHPERAESRLQRHVVRAHRRER